MNKTQLIDAVSEKLEGFSKEELAMALDAITDTIQETVETGESVKLSGFGTYETSGRKGKKGTSALPTAKGKEWTSVNRTVPVFRPSDMFKDRVIKALPVA